MSETNNKKTCGNCKFFAVDAANLKQGNCLRYPPTMCFVAGNGGLGKFTAYPEVKPVMPACGEHIPSVALAS